MAVLQCHEFFRVLLQRRTTTGNVPKTATETEVSFTNSDETEIGNSDLEGENVSYGQNMEGGSSKRSSQQELKEKGKDKNQHLLI
jgi:hypothetical protein